MDTVVLAVGALLPLLGSLRVAVVAVLVVVASALSASRADLVLLEGAVAKAIRSAVASGTGSSVHDADSRIVKVGHGTRNWVKLV